MRSGAALGVFRLVPFVAVALWSAAFHAAAANGPSASNVQCALEPLTMPERYERLHQVPTEPAPNDPSHKMVTPGGMILETPRMVAVTDTLTIAGRDSSALCFEMVTFSRDRRRCEISGVARAEEQGIYAFREKGIALLLVPLSLDQIRVEPIGDVDRKRCQSAGRMEPAVYTLRSSAR